ncbi:rhomboid family intramembrane serine protease [Pseudoxanthomonas wuyuanensis]|uniref:Rhomboid family protein n=1 Tax=Pseudoxanthomonas wuyuanensis TaxID=1073196 RepID=A0A286CX58_9GAMM|nr:rhomboid family intramembrane serine protease [Pseudoxanthomonas wuyuanensis]KAF1720846.1 rhomboid family intramembrane serine protease [Pseudoxanthomonas wuyuanensis]SOD50996.1 Rhomboid family protein [Pseudoxanthomonas wuyuanensis]
MQAPITLVLIAVTCAVSLLAFKNAALAGRLILWPPAIDRHKQYDRLVTYGFLHADFFHLLFNMVTLFFFGRIMEDVMVQITGSRITYVAFYLAALVVSVLPTYLKHQKDPNYSCLGASGAVSAVLFAFVLINPWARILVFVIPMPAIVFAVLYIGYSIWMDRRGGDNVNHGAHLAGAAFGILFMVAMEPRVIGHFIEQLSRPGF